MSDVTLLAAFIAGLVGSAHCLGMCGGIISALSMAAPNQSATLTGLSQPGAFNSRRVYFVLLYNLGRIVSYAIAGAVVGGLGQVVGSGLFTSGWAQVFRLFSGLLMVMISLQVLSHWRGLGFIERMGSPVWRRLSPLTKRMMPVHSPKQALALGMLWGWIPCGLVYTLLLMAVLAGSAVSGALVMVAFGLGTLPSMMITGLMAARVTHAVARFHLKKVGGVLLLIFGLWTMAMPLLHLFGAGHHADHGQPSPTIEHSHPHQHH